MPQAPVALITAASRGMGAACARLLAARGYRLALLARGDDLAPLAHELGALAVTGSVATPADVARFVHEAQRHYGRVDAVINNTGHAAKGGLLELSDADWHAGLELLFLSVVRMARLVTPIMLAQGTGGAFVNISTFAALEPAPRFPVSGTIRATLGPFAKLYTQQYASARLRMNNLLPGWIETYGVSAGDQALISAQRPGTPEEVARAAAFLVSEEAAYISGQSLLVDGGLVRGVH